ncbi:hypothetical protein [uncultured Duncaniella sp.]|uniref:hypothetical protein n=1 Tax=uncultured Duncaniella sp. TaxID=2768039 RepID=UPI002613FFBF|nr:hypothetical protein [uncultured Duncaniella sp.]
MTLTPRPAPAPSASVTEGTQRTASVTGRHSAWDTALAGSHTQLSYIHSASFRSLLPQSMALASAAGTSRHGCIRSVAESRAVPLPPLHPPAPPPSPLPPLRHSGNSLPPMRSFGHRLMH